MRFLALGALRVLDRDGREIPLVGRTQRRLLCRLLASAGYLVDSDSLADQLGLSPGALRTSVSRLRARLAENLLISSKHGYCLTEGPHDVSRFESLLQRSRRVSGPRESVEVLRTALELWREDAYGEFAHEHWVLAESRRLGEMRADAIERLAAALIELGDHAEAIGRLEWLIADQPFRDLPRSLMMQALAASGRRVEALRTFQSYRRFLLEEVGTAPGDDITALDREIAGAARAAPPIPTDTADLIASICSRMDSLQTTLGTAAARTPGRALDSMLARLDADLRVLEAETLSTPGPAASGAHESAPKGSGNRLQRLMATRSVPM